MEGNGRGERGVNGGGGGGMGWKARWESGEVGGSSGVDRTASAREKSGKEGRKRKKPGRKRAHRRPIVVFVRRLVAAAPKVGHLVPRLIVREGPKRAPKSGRPSHRAAHHPISAQYALSLGMGRALCPTTVQVRIV